MAPATTLTGDQKPCSDFGSTIRPETVRAGQASAKEHPYFRRRLKKLKKGQNVSDGLFVNVVFSDGLCVAVVSEYSYPRVVVHRYHWRYRSPIPPDSLKDQCREDYLEKFTPVSFDLAKQLLEAFVEHHKLCRSVMRIVNLLSVDEVSQMKTWSKDRNYWLSDEAFENTKKKWLDGESEHETEWTRWLHEQNRLLKGHKSDNGTAEEGNTTVVPRHSKSKGSRTRNIHTHDEGTSNAGTGVKREHEDRPGEIKQKPNNMPATPTPTPAHPPQSGNSPGGGGGSSGSSSGSGSDNANGDQSDKSICRGAPDGGFWDQLLDRIYGSKGISLPPRSGRSGGTRPSHPPLSPPSTGAIVSTSLATSSAAAAPPSDTARKRSPESASRPGHGGGGSEAAGSQPAGEELAQEGNAGRAPKRQRQLMSAMGPLFDGLAADERVREAAEEAMRVFGVVGSTSPTLITAMKGLERALGGSEE